MKEIENTKKESPFLGLTGMGGGVGSLMFVSAGGDWGPIWGWGGNWAKLFAPQAPSGSPGYSPPNFYSRSSPVLIDSGDWLWFKNGGQATHWAAIDKSNNMYMWGSQSGGALGNNKDLSGFPNEKSFPQRVQLPGTWTYIDTDAQLNAGIKGDGSLWVWGNNNRGALGMNAPGDSYKSSPTQIPGTWATVSCGAVANATQMLAVNTDGELWTWGQNQYGKLGLNQAGDYWNLPQTLKMSSPMQIGSDTTWSQEEGSVGVAEPQAFAIKTDGTLWGWGGGEYGALGMNNHGYNAMRSSPVQLPGTGWARVMCQKGNGQNCNYAIKTNGQFYSWGENGNGQLGHNDRNARSAPTQIPGSWKAAGTNGMGEDAMMCVKEDGTLWSWGGNVTGQLGINVSTSPGYGPPRSSPCQIGAKTDWLMACPGHEGTGTAWGSKG